MDDMGLRDNIVSILVRIDLLEQGIKNLPAHKSGGGQVTHDQFAKLEARLNDTVDVYAHLNHVTETLARKVVQSPGRPLQNAGL